MKPNWRVLVLPLLMVVVAAAHGFRVETYDENPWVGAGFGMFARIDGPQRVVVIVGPDGESALPASATQEINRAASFPTTDELERLLDHLDGQGVEVSGVRVLRPLLT
ncbi:MAG: hypothetical protein L0Z49_10070, partial [Actinobacteria bacterium]|nr:hypothetical protein [Actinomycetota bacterium]